MLFFFLSCNVVVNVLFLSAFFIVYFHENSLFIYHVRIIDMFNFRFSSLFPLLTKAQLHRRSLSLSVAGIISLFPSHIPLSFILPDLFFTIPPSPPSSPSFSRSLFPSSTISPSLSSFSLPLYSFPPYSPPPSFSPLPPPLPAPRPAKGAG